MKKLVFEWDDKKAIENKKKHGVTFEEAQSVFFDDQAIQFWDSPHSEKEDRFLMLGLSYKLRILLVVHCFRETDSTIRIISARKATKTETLFYPGG
jgi:uncharacterized DUF497 family protein